MKCVIALNGEYSRDYIFPENAFVIACDGAYAQLIKNGVKVDCVLGDFDSLGFVPDNAIVYPKEKDLTDGEIGLETALKSGYNDIDIINFGGKREDHFLGNLSLLMKAYSCGASATAFTNNSKIRFLSSGKTILKVKKGATVSLFTFGGCRIDKSKGLKYVYSKTELLPTATLGISNIATDEQIELEIKSGNAFFIENIANV